MNHAVRILFIRMSLVVAHRRHDFIFFDVRIKGNNKLYGGKKLQVGIVKLVYYYNYYYLVSKLVDYFVEKKIQP